MKHHKTQLAVAVGAALLVFGTAVQAQVTPVTPAQANITVQLYGQVHRALMNADDGFSNKTFHVDGQPSSTRFGINATGQAAPGLRVGARLETEMKSNPSNVVNFATPSVANTFAERWLDLSFATAGGTINMGQGSGAADDASTLDLSGTGLANGNCTDDWGGGIVWRTSAGGTLGTTNVSATHACNDFESRYDRLMYTTPVFGGFRAQVGFGQKTATGESTEFSLWYSGRLAGELQAAIGWSNVNLGTPAGVPDRETTGGSISWLHTSGFNITFAHTNVDGISASATDGRKGKFTWIKPGFKFGQHAIALDYGMHDDMAAEGDEGKSHGIGYQWNPIRWAELYASYHFYTLDRAGTALEDIKIIALGTRIRF